MNVGEVALIYALEKQMVDEGIWKELLVHEYLQRPLPDGLTPKEHCRKFGHTFQLLRFLADDQGAWRGYYMCQFCGVQSVLEGEGWDTSTLSDVEEEVARKSTEFIFEKHGLGELVSILETMFSV